MPYLPAGLTLLALCVVVGGFLHARKSARPTLLRVGASVTALGLVLLWILPSLLFGADRGIWAMPLFIAALLVAGSTLGLGLQLVSRAFGAPPPTRGEALWDDLIRHNDLP